ncbi:MAG: hypothetical protein AAF170_04745 [Bacteroidota bacterium]
MGLPLDPGEALVAFEVNDLGVADNIRVLSASSDTHARYARMHVESFAFSRDAAGTESTAKVRLWRAFAQGE